MTPSSSSPHRWTRLVVSSVLAAALLGGAALPAVASSSAVVASEDKAAKDAAKLAKEAEKAAKQQQKAEDKAAKEAQKEADKAAKESDKAAKETQKADDKAAKEAQKAEDKAAKEADKAAKEQQKAEDKAAKDAQKAADKAAKEAAKAEKQRQKACKKDPTQCATGGNNPGGNNPGGNNPGGNNPGGGSGGNPSVVVPLLPAACPPGVVPASPFRDVANNVHRPSIDCLAWWKLAAGLSAQTYGPGRPVTRGQTATFFARLIEASGASLPAAGATGFRDVRRNVHADSINRMAAAGIVQGMSPRRFAPSQPVTRAQMVTMLVGAYEYVTKTPLGAGSDAFDDDNGNVHQGNINKASGAGLARGQSARSFNPGGKTRRDQMASFLARLLDQLVSRGHGVPPNRR